MTQAPRARVARRPVHGVLLIDKPLGLSSNHALQKAKWLLRAQKAGHAGTLDPLASGLLVLCFGAATKFSQLQLDANKCYEAVLKLGEMTTTGDAEGEVTLKRSVQVEGQDLAAIAARFTGPISQTPPMYSALKKDGKALYDYARAGQTVAREPRRVTIHELSLAWAHDAHQQPQLKARVCCSKGTYVRTLGEDIGEAMGCGAHLSHLRRLATASFTLADSLTLEALEAMPESDRLAALLPVDAMLAGLPSITLALPEAARFLSGLPRRGSWGDADLVAVYGPEQLLLGSASVRAGVLTPVRLLNSDEISQIQPGHRLFASTLQQDESIS